MTSANDTTQTMRIELAWETMKQVRRAAEELGKDFPDDVRDATVMAASELAENLVKYGRPMGDDNAGYLSLSITNGKITISSRNGVNEPRHVDRAVAIVETLQTKDAAELYVERLHEMLKPESTGSSALGLLRIAYEGGFTIQSTFEDGILTLTAEREL